MKKILKILTVILIIIVAISIFAFDNRLKIVDYELKTDKISSDVKLALITDLHCCLYGENQSQLIDAIDKNKPDAVLLGGDIFDNKKLIVSRGLSRENIKLPRIFNRPELVFVSLTND